MPNTAPAQFDVCVACALPEEFDAFESAVSTTCQVTFQSGRSHKGRPYKYATIKNTHGELLHLHLSLPPEMGPEAMSIHLTNVLGEFKPTFAAMTGICAGDRTKVKLGDLVVAERSFSYDRGKVVQDENGRDVLHPDTRTYSPDTTTLMEVGMFKAWQQAVQKLERPPSKRQQKDWLLDQLSQVSEHRLEQISPEALKLHVPNVRKILGELQRSSPPLLSADRQLINLQAVAALAYGPEEFPFIDPAKPERHTKAMASGNAVRSDDPFATIQLPVRTAVAIDMESSVFYRVVTEEFPGMRALVVKGVCDYADSDKDDSYHKYAAEASAIYLLTFIQAYIAGSKPAPPAQPEPAPPADIAGAQKLYFCCSPKDIKHRKEIEKHLILQVRLKRLIHWHSYDPDLGAERTEERVTYLQDAQIILLLLSPDLITQEFFHNELQQAYTQYSQGKTRVIAVLLRKLTRWEEIPFGPSALGELMPIPRNNTFIVHDGFNFDQAFADVGSEIMNVILPKQEKKF